MTQLINTLSGIAIEHAEFIGTGLAVALLLLSQHIWGGWPDLWRARRVVLPHLAKLGRGEYDDELDVVDDRVDADLDELTDEVPEKTEMPLQDREFAGVIDRTPAEARALFRSKRSWWPCWLASIQYVVDDGDRVYEVGSYAFREEGLLGSWQVHVRLTPIGDGTQTALWAHREYNPWRHPVAHYRAIDWSAAEGVAHVEAAFEDESWFKKAGEEVDTVLSDDEVGA